jgi:hypothetical protein
MAYPPALISDTIEWYHILLAHCGITCMLATIGTHLFFPNYNVGNPHIISATFKPLFKPVSFVSATSNLANLTDIFLLGMTWPSLGKKLPLTSFALGRSLFLTSVNSAFTH